MDREFVIPAIGQSIRDLELPKSDRIFVENVTRVCDLDPSDQESAIDKLTQDLQSTSFSIASQDDFDMLYSFVRFFDVLSVEAKGRLLDLLCIGFSATVTTIANSATDDCTQVVSKEQRNAVKVWLFYLVSASLCAEKQAQQTTTDANQRAMSKGTTTSRRSRKVAVTADGFDWSQHRDGVLRTILSSIVSNPILGNVDETSVHAWKWVDIGRAWSCGLPEENFVNLYWSLAEALLDSKDGSCNDSVSRILLLHLVAVPVHRFHSSVAHSIVSSLSHSIRKHEHFPKIAVEISTLLASEVSNRGFGDERLPRELILDIGRISVEEGSRDTSGIKNIGEFLELLAQTQPRLLLSNLSVLLPHLGGEVYRLRCSIVSSIASLVIYLRDQVVTQVSEEDRERDVTHAADRTAAAETRNHLLDVLAERIHDVNSYVRAAALKALCEVCANQALPLSHLVVVTDIATDRLFDKSSTARKHAIVLLGTLLENNPYNAELTPHVYAAKIAKVQLWFEENGEEPIPNSPKQILGGAVESIRGKKASKRSDSADFEEILDDSDASETDEFADESEAEEENPERRAKIKMLEFCKSALIFITKLEQASSEVCDLLSSKSTSDVQEALRFLTKAHTFKLPGAQHGVRKLLGLVWDTRESGAVKKELLETFEQLYIQSTDPSTSRGRRLLPPDVIADNLIGLVQGATLSELTSLERVVAELMQSDGTLKRRVLPPEAVESLWEVIASSSSIVHESEEDQSEQDEEMYSVASTIRATLCLISMVSKEKPRVVDRPAKLKQLLQLCEISPSLKPDFQSIRYALMCMSNATDANVDKLAKSQRRLAPEDSRLESLKHVDSNKEAVDCDEIWKVVEAILCSEWGIAGTAGESDTEWDFTMKQWYPAAEQCICLVFALSKRPDRVCEKILATMYNKMIQRDGSNSEMSAHPEYLSRVMFAASFMAIKLLVFSEDVASLAKQLRNTQEELEAESKKKKKTRGGNSHEHDQSDTDGVDDLMEGGGDDEQEALLRQIAEVEITSTLENLLGMLSPLILRAVANAESRFMAPQQCTGVMASCYSRLQESAVLGLCRFMSVSNSYCEKHLPFLFTLLRDAEEPFIRANIMIALGDLAFRFPNTVEPFTAQIYQRLRDPNVGVRKNTLMVLTHLILNDMIKVRGEISEIAGCLEDEEERIQDLAGLFFNELAKKGNNPVYNLLPDAIGRLSRDESVSPKSFKTIAKFLSSFIKLDKHTESLGEKFCHRIFAASGAKGHNDSVEVSRVVEIQQCRDFAMCMEHLRWRDKALKKLTDTLFKLYRPVLADEAVYNSFMKIANKSKSFCKQETKQMILEWEEKLRVAHERQSADENTAVAGDAAISKKGKRVTGRRSTRKSNKAAENTQSEDSDDEGQARQPRRSSRATPLQEINN